MNIDEIEHFICNECPGTNMELFGVIATDSGIEVDLFDYLEKSTDFESDCESLFADVSKNLDTNLKCSMKYKDNHCIITVGE